MTCTQRLLCDCYICLYCGFLPFPLTPLLTKNVILRMMACDSVPVIVAYHSWRWGDSGRIQSVVGRVPCGVSPHVILLWPPNLHHSKIVVIQRQISSIQSPLDLILPLQLSAFRTLSKWIIVNAQQNNQHMKNSPKPFI